MDNNSEKARKLSAFKNKLQEKRIVKYWGNEDHLVNDAGDVGVAPSIVYQARHQLEALGLIVAVSKTYLDETYIAWTLTEKGRRYNTQLKVPRSPTGS